MANSLQEPTFRTFCSPLNDGRAVNDEGDERNGAAGDRITAADDNAPSPSIPPPLAAVSDGNDVILVLLDDDIVALVISRHSTD